MNFKKISTTLVSIVMLVSFDASAGLITENWEFTITQGVNSGSVYLVLVSYNTDTTGTQIYTDGPDEVAEYGEGDDLISHSITGGIWGSYYSSKFNFGSLFSDNIPYFDNFFAVNSSFTPIVTAQNNSFVYFENNYSQYIRFGDNYNFFYDNDGGNTRAWIEQSYRRSGSTSNFSVNLDGNFEMISSTASSVPEPSTLAIFALGMMGLASRRRNK